MIAQLEDIKAAFDKVKIETSKATVEENDESGVAKVSSTTKVNVTPEDFKALQASVNKLRTSFIQ